MYIIYKYQLFYLLNPPADGLFPFVEFGFVAVPLTNSNCGDSQPVPNPKSPLLV
jgi:hypothetical protein